MSTKEQGKLHLDELGQCPVCAAEQGSGCVSIGGALGATPLRPDRIHKSRSKATGPLPRPPAESCDPVKDAAIKGLLSQPLAARQGAFDRVKVERQQWYALGAAAVAKELETVSRDYEALLKHSISLEAELDKAREGDPRVAPVKAPSIREALALIDSVRRDARDAERYRKHKARQRRGKREQ